MTEHLNKKKNHRKIQEMQINAETHTQESHENTKLGAIICIQRFCKVKIRIIIIKNNNWLNIDAFEFVGHLLLGMGSTLKSVFFSPSETPLEKTNFLFASGYQLEIISGLKMG